MEGSIGEKLLSEALPLPPEGTNFATDDPRAEFRLVGLLGKGAVGSVYAGIHRKSNARVAVKVVYLEGDKAGSSLNESEAMEKLHHENIITFYASYTFVSLSRSPS